MLDLKAELELAERAARAAGSILSERFGQSQSILESLGKDIKLEGDRQAEDAILEVLSAHDHPVLGEESGGADPFSVDGPVWVVDPLDGTFNYSRGSDLCCVSVGLWSNREPVLGVVHAFERNETYLGIPGEGAWLNGTPIYVSEVSEASDAALVTGFPVYRDYASEAVTSFVHKVRVFKKIRMLGTAALSLAFIAAGKADLYHEESIMIWDVAAGLALVRAAGGVIDFTDTEAGNQEPLTVSAGSTPALLLEARKR